MATVTIMFAVAASPFSIWNLWLRLTKDSFSQKIQIDIILSFNNNSSMGFWGFEFMGH